MPVKFLSFTGIFFYYSALPSHFEPVCIQFITHN